MRLSSACFTVFDVETTGLYPYSGDKICEIGAVKFYKSDRKQERYHSLVDPEIPISYGAFSVNGITEDMVKEKPTIEKALPSFLQFIEGSVLVAYNAGFDLGFLECALGEDKDVLNDYYIIDALKLARRLFPGLDRYNLASVSQSLGIASAGEHRAMADAVMTLKVFKKELEVLASDGVKSVEDIARSLQTGRGKGVKTVKDYKIRLIEEAIREQKKLDITYRSVWNNSVTKRTITPKELQRGYDRSYVIAHCHLKNEERNFRLDCIMDARPCK